MHASKQGEGDAFQPRPPCSGSSPGLSATLNTRAAPPGSHVSHYISSYSPQDGAHDPIVRGRQAHFLTSVWARVFDISGADGSFLIMPSEWMSPTNESLARRSLDYVAAFLGLSPWDNFVRLSRRTHVGTNHAHHLKLALEEPRGRGAHWALLYTNKSQTDSWMCSGAELGWLRSLYRDDNSKLRTLLLRNVHHLRRRHPAIVLEDTPTLEADLPTYLNAADEWHVAART